MNALADAVRLQADSRPIRLIEDGRGLFPISPRIQALDG
jgi:hypothetical protein